MAKNYSDHSRFFFANKRELQDKINAGTVNAWDIVVSSDSKEFILITDQFDLIPIQSRVYRFTSISSAETFLNSATDTYQGQLVSILNPTLGTYQAYVVNKNNANRFYVSPISIYNASDINYNEIGNRPIEQISGNIENPVILADQDTGLYKVEGAFKISDGLLTIFQSYNGDLISVTHYNDQTTGVKHITSSSITDYLVNNNGEVIDKQEYITKQWIISQGYVTESYIDNKLEAMNIITRNEAMQYIQALVQEGIQEGIQENVNQIFDDTFNTRFDARLRESLRMEEQSNIRDLFN